MESIKEPKAEVYQLAEKSKLSEIVDLAKTLSSNEMYQLSEKLDLMMKKDSKADNINFSKFLLSGPMMDDTQFESFIYHREVFNQWRKK
jgi:hypothetical protein